MKVFPVTVENVMPIWPQWEPLLKIALRNAETHDALDVRRAVLGEQAHLWAQWSDRLEAFVVTEFATYPKGVWLRLWLAGCVHDADFNSEALEDALAAFKDAHNCRGYELIGRMGWLRRFPEARFVGVVMRTTT